MVAKIEPPYSFRWMKLANKDSIGKTLTPCQKMEANVKYRTTDTLDLFRHLVIEARYSSKKCKSLKMIPEDEFFENGESNILLVPIYKY